jgi:hypothetical protein
MAAEVRAEPELATAESNLDDSSSRFTAGAAGFLLLTQCLWRRGLSLSDSCGKRSPSFASTSSVARWPASRITLRQGVRVVHDTGQRLAH